MLEEIRIQNFAIIESVELTFNDGLNVITGETGAGKSIIVDAVELLVGGRAEASMVRAGAEKAVVEAVFALTDDTRPFILPLLAREELTDPENPHIVVLSREIRQSGRSSARINGVTANLAVLTEIGSALVDIHGQSEHLSLLKASAHLDLIDRYAGLLEMREGIGELVVRLGELRREIRELEANKAEIDKRAARLADEVEEIEAADLKPGEDDALRDERTRLANSEQLATLTNEASLLLHGDDESSDRDAAVDQLQQVAVILSKLAAIDKSLHEDADLAESISDMAQELSLNLRSYADEVEYDPQRLDDIEERLEVINALRRRYGITIEHVLEHAERAREELERLENSDERLEELRQQEDGLLQHIGDLANTVHKERVAAGARLSDRIVQELGDLRMGAAKFEVGVTTTADKNGCYVDGKRLKFNAMGIDDVEFMMSANPGEPLRPLIKVASGGEMARIMLALKRALTLADPTPTLIFDEIDQGIGGRLGAVVGEKLWNLSANHQVFVVTHLAQLAGFADAHYRVEKRVVNERTSTHVYPLDNEEARTVELADMLGTAGESGAASARELLLMARGQKQTD